MMVRAAIKSARVDIGLSSASETVEEIGHKFRLQIADQSHMHFCIHDGRGPSGKIYCGKAQSFIHRHHEISGAEDAALVSQCLCECLAQRDSYIFYRVMLVNDEVTIDREFKIKSAMMGEQLQHVVKEANSG